jgi:two-component system, sensor histidine kinase and response regulator
MTLEPETLRSDSDKSGVILIVDDHPANLGFLFEYLERSGFKVLVAMDGEEALSQLQHAKPDLVLLDIMMPGLDGFQTCARIKSTPGIEDIPIIFMSARTETQDKVKGFQVGAVDYVDKPVHKEEVLARVNAHISLRKLQKELRSQNSLLAQRHRELEERNEELDAFSHMVAHDLRNALSRVLNFAELLLETASETWTAQDRRDLEKIRDSALRMHDVIESMLLLARMSRESVTIKPLPMDRIIARVLQDLDLQIGQSSAEISVPSEWPLARGYAPWVERIWFNYISNGIKYAGDPPRLALGADLDDEGMVRFWIRDNGPGLSDAAIAKVFQPFVRGQSNREGFGIGLAIVHRIVNRLGGMIGARNLEHGGCEFSFALPRAE